MPYTDDQKRKALHWADDKGLKSKALKSSLSSDSRHPGKGKIDAPLIIRSNVWTVFT